VAVVAQASTPAQELLLVAEERELLLVAEIQELLTLAEVLVAEETLEPMAVQA